MSPVIWIVIATALVLLFGIAMHLGAKPEIPLPTPKNPDPLPEPIVKTKAEIDRDNEAFMARQPFNQINPEKSFVWEASENGNPTCEWNLLTCTVFPQDGFWKYVISPVGGDRDDAMFSKGKGTEENMKIKAEKKMREMLATALSNRPIA